MKVRKALLPIGILLLSAAAAAQEAPNRMCRTWLEDYAHLTAAANYCMEPSHPQYRHAQAASLVLGERLFVQCRETGSLPKPEMDALWARHPASRLDGGGHADAAAVRAYCGRHLDTALAALERYPEEEVGREVREMWRQMREAWRGAEEREQQRGVR